MLPQVGIEHQHPAAAPRQKRFARCPFSKLWYFVLLLRR
jgi:hypothetical protein